MDLTLPWLNNPMHILFLQGGECACACSSACARGGRVGLCVQVYACRAWFGDFFFSPFLFGRVARVCMCICVWVCMCLPAPVSHPQGLEVTAVRKQIDFSPPTHKQLTTRRSIRVMLEKSSDKPLPWPGICVVQTDLYSTSVFFHAEKWRVVGATEVIIRWWGFFLCPALAKLALPVVSSISGIMCPSMKWAKIIFNDVDGVPFHYHRCSHTAPQLVPR